MNYLLAFFKFLGELFGFSQWFTNRKDQRQETANSTKALERHDQNEAEIDKLYPDSK
jgi:hypothetical protein